MYHSNMNNSQIYVIGMVALHMMMKDEGDPSNIINTAEEATSSGGSHREAFTRDN